MGKPLVDGGFEFRGAAKGSAADHSAGDQRKEALDLVEPGTAGGGEVEFEPASFAGLEPALDFGTFVSAVVIHDQVNFQIRWELLLQSVKKANKLAGTMAGLAGAQDLAIENIESRKQGWWCHAACSRGFAVPAVRVVKGEGVRCDLRLESGSFRQRTTLARDPGD